MTCQDESEGADDCEGGGEGEEGEEGVDLAFFLKLGGGCWGVGHGGRGGLLSMELLGSYYGPVGLR